MMESTPEAGLESGAGAVLVDSTDVENGGGGGGGGDDSPSEPGGGMCCNLCGGQPTLWTLIATEEWEQVRERLATRQGAVEVMGEDFSGFSVLASAVSYEPPLDVVQSIVRMNPKAVSSCGLRGLPIHFASEFGASTEVIRFLIGRHPDSVRQTDHRGRTPLHLAVSYVCMQEAQHGYEPPLDSVVALCRAAPEAIRMLDASGDTPIEVAMKYAAKNGDNGGGRSAGGGGNGNGNGGVSSACLGKLSSIFFQFLSDDGLPDFDGEDVTAEDDDVSSDLTVSDDEDFGTHGEEEDGEEEVLLGEEGGGGGVGLVDGPVDPNYALEQNPQPAPRRKSSRSKQQQQQQQPQRAEEGGEETRMEEVRELMQWRRRQTSTKSSVLPADLRNSKGAADLGEPASATATNNTPMPAGLKKTPSGSAAA